VGVQKKVIMIGWSVDLKMNLHGLVGISGAMLSAPEDVFTLNGGSFSVRDVQNCGLEVVLVCLLS
jgi:hypothetical protein